MEFRKISTSVAESREKENLLATVAQQAATIDYIAIMADVELPNEETSKIESEE